MVVSAPKLSECVPDRISAKKCCIKFVHSLSGRPKQNSASSRCGTDTFCLQSRKRRSYRWSHFYIKMFQSEILKTKTSDICRDKQRKQGLDVFHAKRSWGLQVFYGGGQNHVQSAIFFCSFLLNCFFHTLLSQWEFSHGKFGLLSPRKSSCDRVTLTTQP